MAQNGPEQAGMELLETLGRPVVQSHGRLAALLRARLGSQAAALFATPSLDGAGRITGWSGESSRALRGLNELAAPERAQMQARAAELISTIDRLAEQLDEQGDAGRVAAHMLRSALVTPTGQAALMTDGTNPVLTWWGHARPRQPRPDPLAIGPATAAPLTPAPATGAAATAAAGATEAAASEQAAEEPRAPPATAGRRVLPAWAWALPALLLLAAGVLGWRAFAPLAPVTVDVVKPGAPAPDPSVQPLARVEALRQALQQAMPVKDEYLAACVAPPPPVTAQAPEPPPREPKAEPPRPEPAKPEPKKPEPARPPVKAEPAPRPPAKVEPPPQVARPEPPPRETRPPPKEAAPPQPAAPPPSRTAAACNPPWKPEDPPRVVFVLDGSGSMSEGLGGGGSSKIGAAKSSISTVVDHLHPSIRTGMVSFSDCNATRATPLYGSAQRPTLIGQVQGVRPQGGTSLAASITRAGNAVFSTGNLPSTIVVVSDGQDTCQRDPCAAAAAIRSAHPNVTINVIDLATDAQGRAALSCVARSGGGRVFTPQSAGQMQVQAQQASGYPDASACR